MYGQTILQLWNQMLESGRSETDLILVKKAYDLTVQSFSHTYRSSGNPFLVHCVRIGGILEAHGASAVAIARQNGHISERKSLI